MKQISMQIDDETQKQIKELALLWGLPDQKYNTQVVLRCVERVWMLENGYKKYTKDENGNKVYS